MSLLGTYKDKGKQEQVSVTNTCRMKNKKLNITREEMVPTAKSLVPLRYKFDPTKTRYSVNRSLLKFFSSQERGMKTEKKYIPLLHLFFATMSMMSQAGQSAHNRESNFMS